MGGNQPAFLRIWDEIMNKQVISSIGIILGLAFAFSLVFYLIAQVPQKEFWQNLGYGGVLLLSFLGASTVLIPIPYTVVLLSIGPAFEPVLFAASVGVGSGFGEIVGYGLGYTGRTMLGEKEKKKLQAMLKVFERYGMLAVFLFALTPLPDDLLFIPLGLMRYGLLKALVVCVLGKFLMGLILAYSGHIASELFTSSWVMGPTTAVALATVVFLVFKIDWTKLAKS